VWFFLLSIFLHKTIKLEASCRFHAVAFVILVFRAILVSHLPILCYRAMDVLPVKCSPSQLTSSVVKSGSSIPATKPSPEEDEIDYFDFS
jgi:hypothetical protein